MKDFTALTGKSDLYKKNVTSTNILDVIQDKYDSMQDITMSDHKPVYSYFTLNFA